MYSKSLPLALLSLSLSLSLPTISASPVASSTSAPPTKIVVSNDDGWAEINIRQLYTALSAAGNSVVLSAPADNESGTGSSDQPPAPRSSPCEFNSCPANSGAYGSDAKDPKLNWVNSYPVTAMRYGIQNVSVSLLGGKPDLAVAGFNVGANTGSTVLISGTVGAATEASKEGIPAIAFSGATGSQTSYTISPVPNYVTVYTSLSRNVTQTLLASGTPYLPSGIWLNVNFPSVSSSKCTKAAQFKFVLSRIAANDDSKNSNNAEMKRATEGETGLEARGADVQCGGTLPREEDVIAMSGCYASISVGVASTKMDANSTVQALVQKKLNSILSCLPSS